MENSPAGIRAAESTKEIISASTLVAQLSTSNSSLTPTLGTRDTLEEYRSDATHFATDYESQQENISANGTIQRARDLRGYVGSVRALRYAKYAEQSNERIINEQ